MNVEAVETAPRTAIVRSHQFGSDNAAELATYVAQKQKPFMVVAE